jgi:uncharacterized protein (DUF342 family)
LAPVDELCFRVTSSRLVVVWKNGPAEAAGEGDATLILRFRDDQLFAVVEPGSERSPLDARAVRALLAAQGLSKLHVDEDAIARLLKAYAESPERIELAIAERRNGSCRVHVSEDKSVALLTLIPPSGGDPVTIEQVDQALDAAGVVAGILPDEIEAALAEGAVVGRVIARGRHAEHGIDSTFVNLLPEPEERRPQANEEGIIDFRDMGRMTSVREGDLLMRRIPATPGDDGYDVSGQVTKATPGRTVPFPRSLRGVRVDPADPNALCAAISGRPIVDEAGASVEPVVFLPRVDISTGHVDFEGSVDIQGDVSSGMRIRAAGDVVIRGSVGAARITAGGKVLVKGGIVGRGEADGSAKDRAVVQCRGLLQAGFLEYAEIESSSEVLVADHCMHSTVAAGPRVVVGLPGSKTGHVRGGTMSAGTLVRAVTFGSSVGVKTVVRVGLGAHHLARLTVLEKEIDANTTSEADLQKAVANQPDEKNELVLAKVAEQLDRLRQEYAVIKGYSAQGVGARVVADRKFYSGTDIHVGPARLTLHDDHGGGVFRLNEEDVVFSAS